MSRVVTTTIGMGAIALLSIASFAGGAAAGEVILNADFDALPLGAVGTSGAELGEPTAVAPALTAEVVSDGSGGKLLQVCDNHTLSTGFVTFEFVGEEEVTEGTVRVTWTLVYDALDAYTINLFAQGTVDNSYLFLQLRLNSGGVMSFLDADDLVVYQTYSYTTGTPIEFDVELDMDAGTYDVRIDDSLVVENEAHGVVGRGLGRFQVGTGFDFNQGDCFTLDDLLVEKGGATTGVETGVPARAAFSASPNPFNPEVRLLLDLPEPGEVRLAVYDFGGRLVRSLVDGDAAAGRSEIYWNGTDDTGRPVGSGVYFARMIAGGSRETRKLVLIR